MLTRLLHEEDGQTTTEYAMFIALIAMASIVILFILQRKLSDYYSSMNTRVVSTQ